MLKSLVAPELRNLGLRGSGRSYSIPSETHWAVIGFQGSQSNSADLVRFSQLDQSDPSDGHSLMVPSRNALASGVQDRIGCEGTWHPECVGRAGPDSACLADFRGEDLTRSVRAVVVERRRSADTERASTPIAPLHDRHLRLPPHSRKLQRRPSSEQNVVEAARPARQAPSTNFRSPKTWPRSTT